ncbi:MAG: type II toxin-antitoxin system VapC family toxin [Asticcacaulis sp.]
MTLYLLDTNIAAHLMRGDRPALAQRLTRIAADNAIGFSVISQAELYYGWEKRGRPEALGRLIGAFLARVEILPWTEAAAQAYGTLRADSEKAGVSLSAPDMLIAAQAKAIGAVLVSRDKAFLNLSAHLKIEDWTA